MKRYKVEADYNVAGYSTTSTEDPNGEWVRYEDVEKLIKAKEFTITTMAARIEGLKPKCRSVNKFDQEYQSQWER